MAVSVLFYNLHIVIVNGQWSVSVFLFYNMTTPIKRKLPILHIVI